MNAVTLTLPYPPASNNLFANSKSGGRFKSARYTAWATEAGWEAKRQRAGRIEGPYALYIVACRPDARRRDLANLEKAVSDLLVSAGIVEDDSLCMKLQMSWGEPGQTVLVSVISTRGATP